MTITHSARLGFSTLAILEHGILEASLVVALGLGAIVGMGAVILLGMAWSVVRSLPGLRLELEAGQAAAGGLACNAAPVKDGFLLWWSTVGLGLVAMAMRMGLGMWGFLVFYAEHISADLAWYSLWCRCW